MSKQKKQRSPQAAPIPRKDSKKTPPPTSNIFGGYGAIANRLIGSSAQEMKESLPEPALLQEIRAEQETAQIMYAEIRAQQQQAQAAQGQATKDIYYLRDNQASTRQLQLQLAIASTEHEASLWEDIRNKLAAFGKCSKKVKHLYDQLKKLPLTREQEEELQLLQLEMRNMSQGCKLISEIWSENSDSCSGQLENLRAMKTPVAAVKQQLPPDFKLSPIQLNNPYQPKSKLEYKSTFLELKQKLINIKNHLAALNGLTNFLKQIITEYLADMPVTQDAQKLQYMQSQNKQLLPLLHQQKNLIADLLQRVENYNDQRQKLTFIDLNSEQTAALSKLDEEINQLHKEILHFQRGNDRILLNIDQTKLETEQKASPPIEAQQTPVRKVDEVKVIPNLAQIMDKRKKQLDTTCKAILAINNQAKQKRAHNKVLHEQMDASSGEERRNLEQQLIPQLKQELELWRTQLIRIEDFQFLLGEAETFFSGLSEHALPEKDRTEFAQALKALKDYQTTYVQQLLPLSLEIEHNRKDAREALISWRRDRSSGSSEVVEAENSSPSFAAR